MSDFLKNIKDTAGKATGGEWTSYQRPKMANRDDIHEIHWSGDGECVAEIVHGKVDAQHIALMNPATTLWLVDMLEQYASRDKCFCNDGFVQINGGVCGSCNLRYRLEAGPGGEA